MSEDQPGKERAEGVDVTESRWDAVRDRSGLDEFA